MGKKLGIDEELRALRDSYLVELTTQVTEVEGLILKLSHPESAVRSKLELARQIHSIKGVAGGCGLDLISLVAHRMEDILLQESSSQFDEHAIDKFLDGKDTLARLIEAYQSEDQKALESLQHSIMASTGNFDQQAKLDPHRLRRVLLVEPAKTLRMLCLGTLKAFHAETSIESNGYGALGRLLQERFDLVILSYHTEKIEGPDLGWILATVPNPNKETPIVMITSETSLSETPWEPQHLVHKGPQLPMDLKRICETYLPPRIDNLIPHLDLLKKPRSILVIDDSPEIHALLKIALGSYPTVSLHSEIDPLQAVPTALGLLPDLILLDLQMPGVDGLTVLKQLRKIPDLQKTPVFMLTGATSEQEKKKMEKAGVSTIISKPFSPKKIPAVLFQCYDGLFPKAA